ncbi:polysaccharide deacetylase family protein [Marinagarivorans algicola]|uniref:polysaccharide deacetylase family protein n=1 Tax=Marinagarivorans algicola TaxID=1513270 RepID=UPI0037369CF5
MPLTLSILVIGKSNYYWKMGMKKSIFVLLLCAATGINAGDIALSFDDAPTASSAVMSGVDRTTAIIKALKEGAVPDALFFVTTNNIQIKGRERLNQYVQAGYHLGNHSHAHLSANKVSVNDFMSDAYQAHLILKAYGSTEPYFRFPYLHYGQNKEAVNALQSHLAELGYSNGYVTADNFDWYINAALVKAKKAGKTIDYERLGDLYVDVIWQGIMFYDGIAIKTLGRSPKHVLLLHENDVAALFLPKLIRHIKKMGWNIITPKQAYADPIAKIIPDVLFHKQGRVAALAHSKGMPTSALRHASESQEYLDDLLNSAQVFK